MRMYSEKIGGPWTKQGFVWSGNDQISTPSDGTPRSSLGPGLAYYNDRLYMAYKGDATYTLYMSWYDGSNWQGNRQFWKWGGGIDPWSNASPVLVAYNGFLYLFYKAYNSNTIYVWRGSNSGTHLAW